MVEGKRSRIGGRESLRRLIQRRVQYYYDTRGDDYDDRDQGRDDELELLVQGEEERDNEHYFLGE